MLLNRNKKNTSEINEIKNKRHLRILRKNSSENANVKNEDTNLKREQEDSKTLDLSKEKADNIISTNKYSIPYTFIKVIPGIEQEELSSFAILKIISSLDKITRTLKNPDLSTRILKEKEKCGFFVDIDNDNVSFYFQISLQIKELFIQRINEVFKNCKIIEDVKFELPETKKTVCNSLNYKFNDTFSLNFESSNSTLNSLVMNAKWLEDNERIVIAYNMFPISNKEANICKTRCFDILRKEKELYLLKDKTSHEFISQQLFNGIKYITDTSIDLITGAISGYSDKIEKYANAYNRVNPLDKLSDFSTQKMSEEKIGTQIVVMSEAVTAKRRNYNLHTICNSFNEFENDNILIPKKTNVPKLNKQKFSNVPVNLMCISELKKFVELPCNCILTTNTNVEHIKLQQREALKYLSTGNILFGVNDYKGIVTKLYWPQDYNSESLPHIYISPQGAGKTTLLKNQIIDSFIAKQGGIVPDYIKGCDLANEIEPIAKRIDSKRLVVMDANNPKTLPKLNFSMFNSNEEAGCSQIANSLGKKKYATESIIETLNPLKPLTAAMKRILSAACTIAYVQPNGDFNDVINIITDHKERARIVKLADELYFADVVLNKQIEKSIKVIQTLDEYEKVKDEVTGEVYKEVVGTKENAISGILDRINILSDSYILSHMLYGDAQEFDFVDAYDNNKLILAKMPDNIVTDAEKNVISTFLVIMTLYACQFRGAKVHRPDRVNLWIDEIYQVKTCEDALTPYINRLRKLGLKPVLSMHSVDQLKSKDFRRELLTSGLSISLLGGCKKEQFEPVKDSFPDWNVEQIGQIPSRSALHSIHCNECDDWVGVTTTPDWHKE